MSLKGFHIFFITIAVLFCAGFTAYVFLGAGNLTNEMRVPGIATGAAGVALLAYGIWFVKKKAATIIVQ
ncbi:MAG: hypothetical protein WCN98_10235 [Verrucomicrobiaceae bacterium]